MNKGLKISLIVIGIVSLSVVGVFIYKKLNRATEEQFNEFEAASLKSGMDIMEFKNYAQRSEVLEKWKKNLTKKEADDLINAVNMSTPENRDQAENIILPLFAKLMEKPLNSFKG